MDDETLEKNYKFNYNNENDEFKSILKDSVIDELNKEDINKLNDEFNSEFDRIKHDRDYVRKNILKGSNNSINIPVNIKAIITIAGNDNNISNFTKTDLNPLFVIKNVAKLKSKLNLIKDDNNKEKQKYDSNLFAMV